MNDRRCLDPNWDFQLKQIETSNKWKNGKTEKVWKNDEKFKTRTKFEYFAIFHLFSYSGRLEF